MLTLTQRIVCCGAVLTLFAGCGGSQAELMTDPDALPFVQCMIQFQGQPVEQAIVTLHATEGQTPEVACVYDPEDSSYRFITSEGGVRKGGVPEGKYAITIKPGPKCNAKIPAKYSDPVQSGLVTEIKAGENFVPTFELTR